MEPLGQVELLTLLAVARSPDGTYGVALLDAIRAFSGRQVSIAAIYAALDRLQRQGLVRTSLSEPLPQRGGRARREYRVTAGGRARLRQERAAAMRIWQLAPSEGDAGTW